MNFPNFPAGENQANLTNAAKTITASGTDGFFHALEEHVRGRGSGGGGGGPERQGVLIAAGSLPLPVAARPAVPCP